MRDFVGSSIVSSMERSSEIESGSQERDAIEISNQYVDALTKLDYCRYIVGMIWSRAKETKKVFKYEQTDMGKMHS